MAATELACDMLIVLLLAAKDEGNGDGGGERTICELLPPRNDDPEVGAPVEAGLLVLASGLELAVVEPQGYGGTIGMLTLPTVGTAGTVKSVGNGGTEGTAGTGT